MPARAWLALCQMHPNGSSTAELKHRETRYGREDLRYRKELIGARQRKKKGSEKNCF